MKIEQIIGLYLGNLYGKVISGISNLHYKYLVVELRTQIKSVQKKNILCQNYIRFGVTTEDHCDCGANIQILSIASKTEDSKKYKIIY